MRYCGKHGRVGGKAFKNLGGFLIFCDIWGIEERFVLPAVLTGCLCGEFPGGSAGIKHSHPETLRPRMEWLRGVFNF